MTTPKMLEPDKLAELKPCPFCGMKDLDDNDLICRDLAIHEHVIRCAWCHGAAPKSVWNRRALSPPHPEAAKCGTCGGTGLKLEHPAGEPFSQSLAAIDTCPDCNGTGEIHNAHKSWASPQRPPVEDSMMHTEYRIVLDATPVAVAQINHSVKPAELAMLNVLTDYRRQGYGRRMMKLICDEADRTGTVLQLIPVGLPDAMSSEQLEKWYERFGFKLYDGGPWMRREPRIRDFS